MDVHQGIRVSQLVDRPFADATRVRQVGITVPRGSGAAALGLTGDPIGDPVPPLLWCHGCGDRVQRLGRDDLCGLCEEVDARLEAHVGAAMADLVERFAELALPYLHPDDLHEIIDRIAVEHQPPQPRLREVYDRAHRYVDARERRARGVRAGDPPPEG